jgi:putative restriction endonuclease
MERRMWTRAELIIVFNLYLKLPFGKIHTRTPEVIKMAKLFARTVNSIAIRLSNFASCDPHHQNRGVKGMIGGLRQCQPIWDEFSENRGALIFESEALLANKENITIENKFDNLLLDLTNLKGTTKLREVKTRVNQNVFRQIVVSNYSGKCAITGIDLPELLFASHIIPWSKNENERLNPENGICLSALYDKAFDNGLIAIDEKYQILISDKLRKKNKSVYYVKYFAQLEKQTLIPQQRYYPKKEFIQYHLSEIFNKSI